MQLQMYYRRVVDVLGFHPIGFHRRMQGPRRKSETEKVYKWVCPEEWALDEYITLGNYGNKLINSRQKFDKREQSRDLRLSWTCLLSDTILRFVWMLLGTVWNALHQPFSYFSCWTSLSSSGNGNLECFDSKCCLYVLGSGICVLHTVHVCTKAFAADFLLSTDFFAFAFFSAFFCCDWIFWWPRAIFSVLLVWLEGI
jgi:hypothetical protein